MEELLVEGASPPALLAKLRNEFSRLFQFYLGFYIVTYGLGIYVLNLLIGFLSPKVDPELEALDGAGLLTKESDEFRPFIRRLPEFKFCGLSTLFA